MKEIFIGDALFWMVVTWVHTATKAHQIEHCISVCWVQIIHTFKNKRRKIYSLWKRLEKSVANLPKLVRN